MSKTVLIIISILCFVVAAAMYIIGSESSHLSELLDFFYLPIPLGIITLLLAFKKKK